MADKKISALPAATTPLAGTEVLPIVQSGVTDKVSVANLTAGRDISALSATLSNGNLVVGTAGKGIDFSANTHAAGMTSELLDWYEEGTWTPTDASGAGLSFVAVSGNYTRIGNTVFLFGYVRYPVTATTNTARIGGLPFTANSADSVTQGAVTYSQVATIRSVGVAKSTAILDIYTLAGGVPTNADLSNTVLYFNSTYFV